MDVADDRDRYRAIQAFQYEVLDRLAFRDALNLPRRLRLHEKVRDALWTLKRDPLGPPPEHDIRWYSHVSAAGGRIGEDYLKMGNVAAAELLMREAVQTGHELVRIDPEYAEWRRDLSVSYNTLGQLLRDRGDSAGALDAFKRGLEELRAAMAKEPQPAWQRDLAISERLVAEMEMRVGQPSAAAAASERAGEISERLAREQPENIERQIDLAREHEDRADRSLVEGRHADAERYARSAVDIRERVHRLDPRDGRNRRSLARAWRKLGDIRSFQDASADAAEALRIASRHAAELAASDRSNRDWLADAASIRIGLASKLAALGKANEAQNELRAAEADLDQLLKAGSPNPIWVEYEAQAQACAAEIHERREDLGAAEKALKAALETRRRALALDNGRVGRMAVAKTLVNLGNLLWLRRDVVQTESVFREAFSILDALAREDPRSVNAVQASASALGRLGEIKGAMASHAEALALFQESRQRLEQAAAAAPQFTEVQKTLAAVTFNIGYAYLSMGETSTAADWQRRAISLLQPIANTERDKAQLASWGSQLFETENRLANVSDPAQQESRCLQRLSTLEARYGALPRDAARRAELLALYEALRDIQARRGDLQGAQRSYQAMRRLEQ
jgi:tetratricopeptide (TPR) repeat protein